MNRYILDFKDINKTDLALVGSKGANLAELTRIDGIRVPAGFCLSADAYKHLIAETPRIKTLLDQLSSLRAEATEQIQKLSADIRNNIERIGIPNDIQDEIAHSLSRLGDKHPYAVRSSATAEDLPSASFAGQQDTYLNIIGHVSILEHVRKCWASLFTDRAVIYRMKNGFDHRTVYLAVVVQRMVFPQSSGILFTADPVNSHREVVSIDASFGLGEALVSGVVNADNYKVRDGQITSKNISAKKVAIHPLNGGGTVRETIDAQQEYTPALNDDQILRLAELGRKIELHFGDPQDIEWCLADDAFYIVQSRPITTLYPVPVPMTGEPHADEQKRVYISVGHQQMMTDAMKPLGLSFFQMSSGRPMYKAGGRLFVDVTGELASPTRRHILVNVIGKGDPLLRDALITLIERGDVKLSTDNPPNAGPAAGKAPDPDFQAMLDNDPTIVPELIHRTQESINTLKRDIATKSGSSLCSFIVDDIQFLRKSLADPKNFGAIMSGMNASSWVNEKMEEWLGEKGTADSLSQSAPDNITSEMGLALLDVADQIRPYPDVIEYLRDVSNNAFLDDLLQLEGGQESHDAIRGFLDKFGMRCVGEIDITKRRWSENPAALTPIILSHIKNFPPGESKRRFDQGRREALNKEHTLLTRLRELPDGEQKAKETKRMIDLIRTFSGYREYPKYAMINRYFHYRQAMLKEADKLVQSGVIHQREDISYLSFEEFCEVIRTRKLDYSIVQSRKEAYATYQRLTPPRVITSDGEIITGRYKRAAPNPAASKTAAGVAVSSGVVEGRARVVLKIEDANMQEGDILVTSFTDPSWTPLFLSIKGLVTEVGGVMAHGAVIAREYGLPAVLSVENATKLIQDGQRIRVNGAEGYVEILGES